jgi:hypothetical protein
MIKTIQVSMSIITSPKHYVQDRKIEPIDVIEAWDLSHHLACVVKYIARAGRKNPILEDLRKAEWYLARAALRELDSPKGKIISHQELADVSNSYPPQNICDDWQLSDHLCSVLINVLLSQENSSHLSKIRALNASLESLREEITTIERMKKI